MKTQTKTYCRCPFDEQHIIQSAKIKKHIDKCKSPNRKDFEQCQYEPYHWVHYTEIDQHEQACYNARNKNKSSSSAMKNYNVNVSAILPDADISNYHDIRDVNFSKQSLSEKTKTLFMEGIKKEEKMEKGRDGLWKQPDFRQWFERGEKCKKKDKKLEKKPINLNFQDSFDFTS